MNEISKAINSGSSVILSCESIICSLISLISFFTVIGVILSSVPTGKVHSGAFTLTITSLYVPCHTIAPVFNISHAVANSIAFLASTSSVNFSNES
jgi:hypothetical protein